MLCHGFAFLFHYEELFMFEAQKTCRKHQQALGIALFHREHLVQVSQDFHAFFDGGMGRKWVASLLFRVMDV